MSSKIDEPADGGSSDDEEAWQRFKASDDAFKGMGDGSGMSMLKPGDFAWKNDPYQGRRAPGGGVGDAEHWDSTFREAHKPPPAGPPQSDGEREERIDALRDRLLAAGRAASTAELRTMLERAPDYDVDAAAEAAGLPPASAAAEPPTRSATAEAAGLPPASAAEAPSNGYDVNAAAERLARQTAPGASSSSAAPPAAAEVERLEPEEEARLLAAARAEKEKGNEFFKAGDLAAALECYTEAIELCPSYVEERAVFFANRAVVHRKFGSAADVEADCTAALALQPNHVKALLRRAQAREELEKMQEALDDMKKVVEIDPSVAEARRAVPRLQVAAEKKAEELKEQMMGQLKELGNSLLGKFGMSLDNFKAEKDPSTGSYNISFGR